MTTPEHIFWFVSWALLLAVGFETIALAHRVRDLEDAPPRRVRVAKALGGRVDASMPLFTFEDMMLLSGTQSAYHIPKVGVAVRVTLRGLPRDVRYVNVRMSSGMDVFRRQFNGPAPAELEIPFALAFGDGPRGFVLGGLDLGQQNIDALLMVQRDGALPVRISLVVEWIPELHRPL